MLIPIGTDAPVYHWPVVTVGLAIALLWTPENTFTVVWGYKLGRCASATDDEMSILWFSL